MEKVADLISSLWQQETEENNYNTGYLYIANNLLFIPNYCINLINNTNVRDKFIHVYDKIFKINNEVILYMTCIILLLVSIVILFKQRYFKQRQLTCLKKNTVTLKETKQINCSDLVTIRDAYSNVGDRSSNQRSCIGMTLLLLCTGSVFLLLISIPWEFFRLYHIAVAKKAAIVNQGIPPECEENKSVWQSLRLWFIWHFSWKDNPCEEYYTALLVDPLWEVTPFMVLTSAVTRCVTHPLELLSTTIGRCVKLLFVEIPVLWQPLLMLFLILTVLLASLMLCRYRISVPLFLNIEPKSKSPLALRTCGSCNGFSNENWYRRKVARTPKIKSP